MKQSAGILLYRISEKRLEFFLVHPGGPFFQNKDVGWWSVPKGEIPPDEKPIDTAIREFDEETGYKPSGNFIVLNPVVQKGGKQVFCWAVKGDLDPKVITCNTFELEWPPKSGKMKAFAEVDKGGWFTYEEAKRLINEKQVSFLNEFTHLHSNAVC